MEDTLPVGEKGRGVLWVVAVEVRVQLVDDVLVHNGLELASKEVMIPRRL